MNVDPLLIHFAVTAAALSVAVLAVVMALRAGRRSQATLADSLAAYERRLEQLEKQLKIATAGAAGMGQRVLALEARLQQLQKQADSVEAADGAIAYTQAMKLFEQGVDAETIATSCGLSDAEASLMAMIHKSRAA